MPDLDAKALLDLAHERATARLQELTEARDAIVESSHSANLDDEHDPEGPTVGFERAQVSAMLDAARAAIAELNAARERLIRGHYGICAACKQQIPAARLEAQPAARMCISCARRSNQPRVER